MLLFHCQPIPVNLIPNGNVAWFGYNTTTLPTGQCHTKFSLMKNSPPAMRPSSQITLGSLDTIIFMESFPCQPVCVCVCVCVCLAHIVYTIADLHVSAVLFASFLFDSAILVADVS